MTDRRFVGGITEFRKKVYPANQELFEKLAIGQKPDALFVTCADSRIDPCMLTQTKPGELFICRVIGNIVPPHFDPLGGVSATVEYAAAVLRVPEIIVCGHTDCGVMKGALHPDALDAYPSVKGWLKYTKVEPTNAKPTPELLLDLAEKNVMTQLDHLMTYPVVAERVKNGDLTLRGWVYHIGAGVVTEHDQNARSFQALGEAAVA